MKKPEEQDDQVPEARRDQREVWPGRLARVRRSQERTDLSGMTRPTRDPDERRFLTETGQAGPFREVESDPGLPTRTQLAPAVLDRIIRQIVEIARPERIILFGSAARGEMGLHSDVDLLVIKTGDFRALDVAGEIYLKLDGPEAVDVVVVTPQQVERYRDTHAYVIKPALRDGSVVYAA